MKRFIIVLILLFFLGQTLFSMDKPTLGANRVLKDVKIEMVAKLTGPDSVNSALCEDYAVYGCDLGHMFNMGDRVYFVFGDTFDKDRTLWRSNVMAFTSDNNPSDGITFEGFIWDRNSSYYKVKDNNLQIYIARVGNVLEGIDYSPRFLKTLPNSNYSIELKVSESNVLCGSNIFGLIVFRDNNNWLIWGHSRDTSMEVKGIINGVFENIVSLNFFTPFLRISKKDNSYLFYYSEDGSKWHLAGKYLDYLGSLYNSKYGFGGFEWGQCSYNVSIDYFAEDSNFYYFQSDVELDRFLESFYPFNFSEHKYAKELISKDLQDTTIIPTNGVAIGNRIYLFFMAVKRWGEPGYWETNYSGIAVSEDGGWTWKKLDKPRWRNDSNFSQVAICRAENTMAFSPNWKIDTDDILIWGIPAGRFGGVKLMKVKSRDIENPDAYLYFAGVDKEDNPKWSNDEQDAVMIIEPPVGECSVTYNQFLERWIITYLNEESHNIEIREALYPWGPWSDPLTLVYARNYPGLYGAFMHPLYVENQGEIIYFAMSLWEPYNVYWMKARLIK